MKKFLDPDDPFFRHPVARWATVLLPVAWGVLELAMGNPGWAMLFIALGGYAGWKLILRK